MTTKSPQHSFIWSRGVHHLYGPAVDHSFCFVGDIMRNGGRTASFLPLKINSNSEDKRHEGYGMMHIFHFNLFYFLQDVQNAEIYRDTPNRCSNLYWSTIILINHHNTNLTLDVWPSNNDKQSQTEAYVAKWQHLSGILIQTDNI